MMGDPNSSVETIAMAETSFPPLKREPLMEEELPAANPPVA